VRTIHELREWRKSFASSGENPSQAMAKILRKQWRKFFASNEGNPSQAVAKILWKVLMICLVLNGRF
jgi:hypothetical protein